GGEMKRVALLIAALAVLAGTAYAAASSYTQTNLVSDQSGVAAHTDADLVNAWGLTSLPTSPWWVSDNGTNVSTLYRADGTKVILPGNTQHVNVPNNPTGAVANGGPNFKGGRFLFSTEEGKILYWNPAVSITDAQVAVNNSGSHGVYKGLAIAGTDRLYATDFRHGR